MVWLAEELARAEADAGHVSVESGFNPPEFRRATRKRDNGLMDRAAQLRLKHRLHPQPVNFNLGEAVPSCIELALLPAYRPEHVLALSAWKFAHAVEQSLQLNRNRVGHAHREAVLTAQRRLAGLRLAVVGCDMCAQFALHRSGQRSHVVERLRIARWQV